MIYRAFAGNKSVPKEEEEGELSVELNPEGNFS